MDVTPALAPNSDQQTAQDFAAGPRVCTITGVRFYKNDKGLDRIEIRLDEESRPWRPSLGMGDLMCAVWGTESDDWMGQKVELYKDPNVYFGKDKLGGIRISRIGGIAKPTEVTIRTNGKGKSIAVTVQPLEVGAA